MKGWRCAALAAVLLGAGACSNDEPAETTRADGEAAATSGAQTAGADAAPTLTSVDASLRDQAEAFIDACRGAGREGEGTARFLPSVECECLAASVAVHIDDDDAGAFYDELTPLYAIEDDKRREDRVDRFFRDLIVFGVDAEDRPEWNRLFEDALPLCREQGRAAREAAGEAD